MVQDVAKVGKLGSVIKVKDGFARNFLIPNKLAIPATAGNLKKIEQEKEKKNTQLQRAKKDAELIKEKLEHISLTLPALTQEDEKLYGSITSQDIVAALKEENFDIDKNAVILNEPIKSLGIFEVPIKLYPEISATIKVWVVKK